MIFAWLRMRRALSPSDVINVLSFMFYNYCYDTSKCSRSNVSCYVESHDFIVYVQYSCKFHDCVVVIIMHIFTNMHVLKKELRMFVLIARV